MTAKKLRIAVWHNLNSGGAKRSLINQVAGLLKNGHHVETWSPSTADNSYLPLGAICREHVLPHRSIPFKKSPKFVGWIADFRQMKGRVAAMREHCAACAAEINAGNFDLLFSNTCVSFTASSLARYVNAPKVLYLHEPYRRNYETLPLSPWVAPAAVNGDLTTGLFRLTLNSVKIQDRRMQMREEQDNARYFDRILANSFFSRESILRAYGLESEVCYLGIDEDFFKPTGEPVENFLVGLGGIDVQKGVARAVEAVGAIRPEIRPKLIWVGNYANPEYRAEVICRAQQLGVNFEVRVMVKDAELLSLLSRASAMLYTSLLEPFGLAPLEANACGTPVIAISEGGVRETIVDGENGVLVSSANPKTIAAAIESLLTDPGRVAQLRSKCRDFILQRWNKAAAARRLEQALYGVLEARGARKNI